MPTTLALDIYGTLIDPLAVKTTLIGHVTEATAATTWLVSANPFDVIGARACGWRTVWVKRNPNMVFDPWEHAPTVTVSGLTDLLALPEFKK